MASRDPTDEEAQAFLVELTELSRKHNIRIGGCGCCGSPFLMYRDMSKGQYTYDKEEAPELSWSTE